MKELTVKKFLQTISDDLEKIIGEKNKKIIDKKNESEKEEILRRFDKFIRNRSFQKPQNSRHCGEEGHWLEKKWEYCLIVIMNLIYLDLK